MQGLQNYSEWQPNYLILVFYRKFASFFFYKNLNSSSIKTNKFYNFFYNWHWSMNSTILAPNTGSINRSFRNLLCASIMHHVVQSLNYTNLKSQSLTMNFFFFYIKSPVRQSHEFSPPPHNVQFNCIWCIILWAYNSNLLLI